jgi:hypothetical protein
MASIIAHSARRLWATESRFILLRYAGAGLGAAKALIFAHVLDVSAFGVLALVLQTAALLEASSLGGITGLLHRYFKDPAAGEESFARFIPACGAWLAAVAVVALALGNLWDVLFWSGLLFALGIGFVLLEPPLRVRGRLGLIALPPILVNMLSIALVPAVVWIMPAPPLWVVLLAVVMAQFGGQFAFLVLALRRERIPVEAAGRGPLKLWRDYLGHVRDGFPLFLGSMAYMLLAYVDRFFIATFHPAQDLGVHALATQFGLIAIIGLQGWSYVASVRVGHAIKQEADVAAVVPGIAAYNAVSAAAALLYYRRRQAALHRALLAVLAANAAIDLGLSLAGASYLWIIACTGGLFLALAAVTAVLVRRCLREAPQPPAGGSPLAAGAGRAV